ncbi:hypothetical protein GCM10009819_10270 [Agromyces tropicus]|uniref:DUF7363 domain-containing protein n=1 Tax=Agromyces tropicus TaxID=555371 RepID=A0ABP5FLH0_9MICO
MLQDRRVVAEGAATAQLQAELKPIVPAGSTTTLTVRLVRAETAAGGGRGELPSDAPVTVTVVPRGLRFLVGARHRRRVRLPSRGAAELRFTMLATDRGPAEVSVLVRGDDELPLATARLTSEVVAADDHDQAGLARVTAPLVPADPAIASRPTIRVDEETARGRSVLHVALSIGGDRHRFRMRIADMSAFVHEVRGSLADAREAGMRLPRPEGAFEVERRLREIGSGLADRLLDRRARDLLWAHRDGLDGIVLQATGGTALPWELLVVRRPGGGATAEDRFLGQYGMTRWLTDVANPAAVRLAAGDGGVSAPRVATEIASASVVALGAGTGAPDGGAAAAMRNGAGVVVECGGRGGGVHADRFLAAFSAELASGAPLDAASRRAREAARDAGETCALAYAVYGHPAARTTD